MRRIVLSVIIAGLLLAGCGGPTSTTSQAPSDIQTGARQRPAASAAGVAGEPSPTALPAVQPDAAQQQAMQSPDQLVQLFGESIKQSRFTAVEPLMNDEVRARLALASSGGSVVAYYQDRQSGLGALQSYSFFNKHTVYDSDDLIAFDADFQYERQLSQGKILLTRGASGWQIAGLEDRSAPSLGEVMPTEEQRAAMQDPAQVARLFAEGLKQRQYDQLEALFSYFARQSFGPQGSIAGHYRESARRYGKLIDYSLGQPQMQPDDFAEVAVTFIHEQGHLPGKVVLKKTPQGWKISRVVTQDS